jgi:hypothetical protein
MISVAQHSFIKALREKELAEVVREDDKDTTAKNDVQVDQACWIYEQLR